MIPRVMLVGYGAMGKNHYKNLLELPVEIVSVVDIDSKAIESLDQQISFTDLTKALQQTKPEIVAVATNTPTHYEVIEQILENNVNVVLPSLFIEKPFVETIEQGIKLAERLIKLGFESEIPIAFAYLIRHSPALHAATKYIKENQLKVKDIEVTWQKKRKPLRSSPGVHIDETTHAIDTILNYILPELDVPLEDLTILNAKKKHSSSIIDLEKQRKIYGNNPAKLNPVAEIEYELLLGNIPIKGISSFMKEPFSRKIKIGCLDCDVEIMFDSSGSDILYANEHEQVFPNSEYGNKVRREWNSFLTLHLTGISDSRVADMSAALIDLKVTKELDRGNYPVTITRT